MSMRVFVTGGSGFIGGHLCQALRDRGDEVTVVSRHPDAARKRLAPGIEVTAGNPAEAGEWQATAANADAVINLAGAPIFGKRWNAQVRQLIHDSRVDTTRHVVEAIARAPQGRRPRVLVSSSAIGYYPTDADLEAHLGDGLPPVTESSPAGDSFLARVCRDWEAEAQAAADLGVRVVIMRTGVVLGKDGGALPMMAKPFRFFIGGPVGSGQQPVSWIHIDDAVAAYLRALDDSQISGPMNLVAPESATMTDLARAIGEALHRPSRLRIPAFAVRAAAGDMSEVILTGRQATPAALESHGFSFKHPTLKEAITTTLR